MSKYNTKAAPSEPVLNHMGSLAFKQAKKEELAFTVLTTFMDDSYYRSENEILKSIKTLVADICKTDPVFVAKLAVFARTQFNMRSVLPVLIGELAKNHKGDSTVRLALEKAITRPDDITEVIAYIGPENLQTRVKKGLGNAFNKFDSYQMAKYRQEDKTVSLVDAVNLVHPKPRNAKTATALKLLVKGELKNTETWESRLSAGENKADVFKDLLENNKLGYMALLRNLRNIVETGNVSLINLAADKISDKDSVLNSKQLPFRFVSAYKALREMGIRTDSVVFESDKAHIGKLVTALNTALMYSVQNIPLLQGRTAILSDNSSSMGGNRSGTLSAMSQTSTANIANLFATMYAMRADNTYIGLFGDRLINPVIDRTKNLFQNYDALSIKASECGGSTEQGMFDFLRKAVKDKIAMDRIVIFSDCQIGPQVRWYGKGGPTAKDQDTISSLIKEYKTLFPNCLIYTVDLKNYGNCIAQDNIIRIGGWSDKIFDIMHRTEKGSTGLIQAIEEISLDMPTLKILNN